MTGWYGPRPRRVEIHTGAVDPDGGIVEGASGLETGITCIRITGHEVVVLHEFPSQGNTAPLPDCRTGRPGPS